MHGICGTSQCTPSAGAEGCERTCNALCCPQLKGLRLMPSESSFPVPQGTAVSSLGDMERMAQEVVVQAGWARH